MKHYLSLFIILHLLSIAVYADINSTKTQEQTRDRLVICIGESSEQQKVLLSLHFSDIRDDYSKTHFDKSLYNESIDLKLYM